MLRRCQPEPAMQIKVEIDLKPEELQRFLGIPDIGALREELIEFIKERVASDPAGFVRDNVEQIFKSRTVQRILHGKDADSSDDPHRRGPRRR
jgi:hypothetical protein